MLSSMPVHVPASGSVIKYNIHATKGREHYSFGAYTAEATQTATEGEAPTFPAISSPFHCVVCGFHSCDHEEHDHVGFAPWSSSGISLFLPFGPNHTDDILLLNVGLVPKYTASQPVPIMPNFCHISLRDMRV
jgi:hypothetical protein